MKLLFFYLLLIAGFLCNPILFAQKVQAPTLNDGFKNTYFYRLDSKQALKAFNQPEKSPDSSIFTMPVYIQPFISDSLPLPVGNYLKVDFKGNQLVYEYEPIMTWSLHVLDHRNDLCIQLLDTKTNQPTTVSSIFCGRHKMNYNLKTKSYILTNCKSDKRLVVKDKNEVFYFNIVRNREKSSYGVAARLNKFLLRNPVKYAATLYRLYNRCVIDFLLSLKKHRYNYGNSFAATKENAVDVWNNIKGQPSKYGYACYVYFNKPKYKENDTIKFKAHILKNRTKGEWYDKPVLVYIDERDDQTYLGKAYSKRKGAGYDFQFVILDSMDISLDEDHDIVLKDLDSNRLGSGRFTYEDYELKKAVFEIRLANGKKQLKGKPFGIDLNAKDENGLPMPDSRVSIMLTTTKVSEIRPDHLFVPDTLWTYSGTIKNGKDKIIIPDSIFLQANINYRLEVVMQNSENERTDLDEYITYQISDNDLNMILQEDSVLITKSSNDQSKIHVYAEDRFDFRVVDTFVNAPCHLLLNTQAQNYHCENNNNDDNLDFDKIRADVTANTYRTKDSIFFSIMNPRKLSLVYHLFESGKEIVSGMGTDFPFSIAAKENSFYYLTVEYIWAGQTKGESSFIPLFKNTIKFNIEKPAVITPGKEVDFKITATDFEDKPIKDLNILAYSFTQKFGETNIAELPYVNYVNKYDRDDDNMFNAEDKPDEHSALLNYTFWNAKMKLDTNWTYRFRYPSKQKIEFTCIAVEDSVTQFAPFVTDNGSIQDIQYVFIDEVPVYLGFTDKKVAYSFEIDTNYHQIKIRTNNKLLIIDKLKVKPSVKTIFSIDQNNPNDAVKAHSMPDSFTMAERAELSRYVMKINMPVDSLQYAYLEGGRGFRQYINLHGNNYRYDNNEKTVGPIAWRYWNFNIYNVLQRQFEYEPGYTYSFKQDLVKMKDNTGSNLIPQKFGKNVPDLDDELISKNVLLHYYEEEIYKERSINAPFSKNVFHRNCNLLIDYDKTLPKFTPINIILGKPGDFNTIAVYPGNTKEFKNIDSGQYQMLLIDKYNAYRQTGIINIKPNGINFYRIVNTDTIKGNNIQIINEALNRLYQKLNDKKDVDLSILMKQYIGATYKGPSKIFSGKVVDEHKEGIPGAMVKIKGTSIGTMTDADGKFNIDIPDGVSKTIIVSAMGYEEKNLLVSKNLIIQMEQGANFLSEVVIKTPYAPTVSKEKYVGAADVITARMIENMPVSDITRAIEGAAAGVQVTRAGSLNASTKPLIVIDGAPYDGDITTLDASFIGSLTILKDASTTNLYGSRAANGVILITTKKGAVLPEKIRLGLKELPPTMTEDLMVSGLRNNFKDDAYWQPDLVTDENGKVSFKVKFPDDITNWRTIAIATDNMKHTGVSFDNIKSYKPVAASLYLPHFLLENDSAMLIGKSVNYIPDTISVTTTFYQNDSLKTERQVKLRAFYNDTLLVTDSKKDSVKLKYIVTKEDGYFDGEQKTIPLEKIGVKIAEGTFQTLDMKDTSFTVYPTDKADTLHINATTSLYDLLLNEVDVVRDYGYLCNEQIASKIIAMLTKQRLYNLLHKDFSRKDKDYVTELIRKISKNQNEEHLWGWWDNGHTVDWISTHVLHAILESKTLGYSANINLNPVMDKYTFDLEKDSVHTTIPMLQMLSQLGLSLNYGKYISRLEHRKDMSLNDYFELILLRQKLHLPYKLDRLKQLKKDDVFGNIYWKDTAQYVYNNEILTTVNALKILQNDSDKTIPKNKIINWLLQQRGHQGWHNTYESTQIIEAVAAYLPINDSVGMKPVLKLNGAIQETVSTFPYQMDVLASSPVIIQKTGLTPVYFTWYYNKWDTSNNNLGKSFKVQSQFKIHDKIINYLPAGEPVIMNVHVQVDRSAEYVMIEIPIPAGCSYQSKLQPYSNHEIHREYFENKVCIFCDKLPKGNYDYEIELLPKYQGHYTINPAKVELMYFPVFYGREQIKKIDIRP